MGIIKGVSVPSSSVIKLLSMVSIVSKLFVVFVNRSGAGTIAAGRAVEDASGNSGIGLGVAGFVGRYGGLVGWVSLGGEFVTATGLK